MHETKVVTKSLAGAQDLLRGVGSVQQNRANKLVTVNALHLFMPVETAYNLALLDPVEAAQLAVIVEEGLLAYYQYSLVQAADSVKSTVASGWWNPIGVTALDKELAGKDGSGKIGYILPRANAVMRTVASRLGERPSILDYDADSANDDSARFKKAILDGADNIYIPGIVEVRAMGGAMATFAGFKVGEIDIGKSLLLHGVSSAGINPVGSRLIKVTGAAYGLNFDGTGQELRPMGGGLSRIQMVGQTASDNGALVKAKAWSYWTMHKSGLMNVADYGLRLQDVMESAISESLFRRLGNNNAGAVLIDEYASAVTSNVNNLHLGDCTFGYSSGPAVKVSERANLDVFWLTDNKFEYDGTPAAANTDSQYVLDFGYVSDAKVTGNRFAHYTTENNKYGGILRMRSACLGTTTFSDNKMFACTGNAWNVEGGTIEGSGNSSNRASASATMTTSITSNRPIANMAPLRCYTSNGNLAALAATPPANFFTSHNLPGAVRNPFVADSAASNNTVLTVPAATEARRMNVPVAMRHAGGMIEFEARVRCTDAAGANGAMILAIDGIDVAARTVTASAGWQLIKWQVKRTAFSAGLAILRNSGSVEILLDGIFCTRIKHSDWSFAWTPGVIAGGQYATSPIQSYNDTVGEAGVTLGAVATANAEIPGLDLKVSLNSNGTIVVYCHNTTGGDITPTFSRINVRIFL